MAKNNNRELLSKFISLSIVLRLLSGVPVVICLTIPACRFLLVFGPGKSYFKTITIAIIVNIVTNMLLVNTPGATGTVLSIMVTALFTSIRLNVEHFKNNLAIHMSQCTA